MTLFQIIGTLLIGPLKLIFEVIFSLAHRVIGSPGLCIIVLSLAMNVLALPLYRRADAIQEEARDTENRLKDVVTHIKKHFSGDERMMILQTYYRQNNYSPLSVLSGSISLMLEIPFFMAAYQFLSGLDALQGVGLGPIADLSAPDGLLVIGGLAINVLPFIMTLINVISSSLYLKGFPLKTKIQLYGMALFFLIFLYNSPAGLVFYWTLNNTFSLVKTLFYKMKNAKQVLKVLVGTVGVVLFACKPSSTIVQCLCIAMQLFWLLPLLQKKLPFLKGQQTQPKPNTTLFILGGLFLSVLVGLLIPSAYISASVQEYIDTFYFYEPVWYMVHTFCMSAGTFLVWVGVFYWLANPKGKVLISRLIWVLSGLMLVNYMFFGSKLGVVSPDLIYNDGFSFALKEHLLNMAVMAVLLVALWWVAARFSKVLPTILLIGSITLACMSAVNIVTTVKDTNETRALLSGTDEVMPTFSLSKKGQNVVVIMLDRGMGEFIPYIMEENPKVLEQFDGFTYYPDTLAYGAFTNFATPSLFGGYDYTPVHINLRDSEKLSDKHNEALKVMPTLFSQNDYAVTVLDPSYAGYKWIPDVSIYDDIPGVSAYRVDGKFDDFEGRVENINRRTRNFFLFSAMKTMPVSLQRYIYNDGMYLAIPVQQEETDTSGVLPAYMSAYNVLNNMTTMTTISEGSENTFMVMRSNATHEPVILQEPDFTPATVVDNSAFYPDSCKTVTAGDSTMNLDSELTISHYHVNMKSLMQLGDWFDYLRQNDLYDNTRIILVSDHGRGLGLIDEFTEYQHNIEFYLPMLLVKDFGATGFTTSDTFMTNADVPTLAMAGLIENPVNPFTGNPINSSFKEENDTHYVILSNAWDVGKNRGTQFLESEWAAVTSPVMEKSSWTYFTDPTFLPPGISK